MEAASDGTDARSSCATTPAMLTFERVGQSLGDRSIELDATGKAFFQTLLQPVAKRCQSLPGAVRQVVGGEPGRRTEGGDEGDALGPRTPATLLPAAVDDRLEVEPGGKT